MATLLGLLQQNPDLVSLIASIVGAAPRLGDMLALQPRLMDGLVDPRFFGAMPRREEISQRLEVALADANSYEEFLDRLRLFGQESLFLIGSRILSGTVSAQSAGVAFADVAEGIVSTIHSLVTDQFARQHGRVKDQETAVLGMGRLGSREMTASSDLDLIFIYDFDHENPDSDGARPLQGGQYFARLTQRLISAFTTRTNHGVLYDIDMRLRPSGGSGPVATRLDAFAQYQDFEAWTWEHMALTRARVVSASPAFRRKIEAVIRGVLTRPRERRIIANDVLEMRQAIAQEKGDADIWDLKYAAGGLIDVEFVAQYLQLVHASEQPSHSRYQHVERARCRRPSRRVAAARCRRAAAGDAPLSGPQPDPPPVPQRAVQAGQGGRRPLAAAGARSGRAGFFRAGGTAEGNAGRRQACVFEDSRRLELKRPGTTRSGGTRRGAG